jgi:protoheme IX farnesyltransferase
VVVNLPGRARPADFLALTKPRIVALVMVTVAAGFYLGSAGGASAALLVHCLLGTALVAGGTNALNQVYEADVDALMRRTRNRPIPSGRLSRRAGSAFAWAVGVGGVLYLLVLVNLIVAALAAATLISYVFLYTPLKRKSSLATLVGAVPGALPVVGGWAAARGGLGPGAWILFALLFLWQLPHFLALAWIYREDYASAGLKMAAQGDAMGHGTFRQATGYAAALFSVALLPAVAGMAGNVYGLGALALSSWMFWAAASAAQHPSIPSARRLFRVSVAYLPGILLLMMADKLP